MDLNPFKKVKKDPLELTHPSPSAVRARLAIEPIPESATLVHRIAELLASPLISTSQQVYKQPAPRRRRREFSNKTSALISNRPASSSSKPHRHSHSNSAGAIFQQPPLSPIDALASVAIREAASPQFNSAAPFYNQVTGSHHALPAPLWVDSGHQSSPTFGERPSKRARSEMLPSPQQASPTFFQESIRPATSHVSQSAWSLNLEQIIAAGQHAGGVYASDSYSQHHAIDPETRRSEAELLLNFTTRGGNSASRHRNAVGQETERWPNTRTGASSPSLPPFPFGLSKPTKTSDLEHPETPSQHKQTLDDQASASVDDERMPDRTDSSFGKSSVQTHTPPEDVSSTVMQNHAPALPSANTLESHLLPQQKIMDDPRMRGHDTDADVNAGKGHDPVVHSHVAPPEQLQSPKSLLADLRDYQTSPLPSEPPLTGLLIGGLEQSEQGIERESISSAASHISPSMGSRWQNASSSQPLSTTVAPESRDARSAIESVPNHAIQTSLSDHGTRCAGCNWVPNSISEDKVDWLQCNGCSNWYHFACAGFTMRDIKRIDKFYCRACKAKHGSTTFVRKSTRVHTTVDYAGLNEGVLRQSDDHPEHHYIEPIKQNKITLVPETFPRMRPEDATADFFEKSMSFFEPVLIPAALNPRPTFPGASELNAPAPPVHEPSVGMEDVVESGASNMEEVYGGETASHELERVPDDGQDRLDMVIPQGLTVRRVAELYGSENHVPVIDVKSQEGDSKKWTVGKWADYYESTGDKIIRNVISLEVSRTPFGRLIRRPKVVRDLDLQDSVWPKGENRKSVGFYCLMSVADSYTDFHIDFGGSSVYYHIVKGKKVFFFIPPTKANLQKYEEWNTLPSQNWTWLPEQTKTKECFRVDLYPGDTMLIPSGWIHSVWTPEDSLVIGGNFLTRLHYGMQFRVAEIEKNNKTGLAFRYPKFQKVMWYTIIKYLEEDPLPSTVRQLFLRGEQFKRETQTYHQFNKFGHNSDHGPENYHARFYPKAELDGLPELVSYIFRTVLILLDRLEGITQSSRKAVSESIPKQADPLEVARSFAMWTAWKRGNEDIPQWAHLDALLPTRNDGDASKKLSTAEFRKLERAGAIVAPERQSARIKTANETTPKTSTLGPRRTACDACRRRKMRCKHIEASGSGSPVQMDSTQTSPIPAPSSLFGEVISSPTKPADTPVLGPLGNSDAVMLPNDKAVIPGGAQLQPDTPDNRKGRTKACEDCRKSKRRCVHDEFGKVDLKKKAEPVVPRGSAKRKLPNGTDFSGGKKVKAEPIAGPPFAMLDLIFNRSVPQDLNTPSGSFSGAIGSDGSAGAPVARMVHDPRGNSNEYRAGAFDSGTDEARDVLGLEPTTEDAMINNMEKFHNNHTEMGQELRGLQAIAGAAMTNVIDSVLDPFLLDEPRAPAALEEEAFANDVSSDLAQGFLRQQSEFARDGSTELAQPGAPLMDDADTATDFVEDGLSNQAPSAIAEQVNDASVADLQPVDRCENREILTSEADTIALLDVPCTEVGTGSYNGSDAETYRKDGVEVLTPEAQVVEQPVALVVDTNLNEAPTGRLEDPEEKENAREQSQDAERPVHSNKSPKLPSLLEMKFNAPKQPTTAACAPSDLPMASALPDITIQKLVMALSEDDIGRISQESSVRSQAPPSLVRESVKGGLNRGNQAQSIIENEQEKSKCTSAEHAQSHAEDSLDHAHMSPGSSILSHAPSDMPLDTAATDVFEDGIQTAPQATKRKISRYSSVPVVNHISPRDEHASPESSALSEGLFSTPFDGTMLESASSQISDVSEAEVTPRRLKRTYTRRSQLPRKATTNGTEATTSKTSIYLDQVPSENLTTDIEPQVGAAVQCGVEKPKRKYTRRSNIETTIDGANAPESTSLKRQSGRQSKPIERLATAQHAETEAWSNKNSKNDLTNGHTIDHDARRAPLTTASRTHKIQSTTAKTPGTSPAAGRKKSTKLDAVIKGEKESNMIAESPLRAITSVVETEEEMNFRVALQLHQEGLGLRRRGGRG